MKWIAAVSLALLSMTANAAFEKTDWNAVGGVFLVRAGEVEPSTPAPVLVPLGLGLFGLLGFTLTSRRRLP